MAYSKQHEIKARRGQLAGPLKHRDDEYEKMQRIFRAQLAERASGVIRLETTLWPKTLRAPWGAPGGMLPTLEALCRHDVIAYFMGQQVKRLKFPSFDPSEALTESPARDDPAELPFVFDEALRNFHRSGKRLSGSGGARISCSRVAQLIVVHQNSGSLDDATLCRVLRMAPQTLAARRRNLRELGLPSLADDTSHALKCLRELRMGLDAEFPAVPDAPPELDEDSWYRAPWHDLLPQDAEALPEIDDVADTVEDPLEGFDEDATSPGFTMIHGGTYEEDDSPDMGVDSNVDQFFAALRS